MQNEDEIKFEKKLQKEVAAETEVFSLIPEEILLKIFLEVLKKRPQNLSISKRWHAITQDKSLWKGLYEHFISSSLENVENVKTNFIQIFTEYKKITDKKQQLAYIIYHGYEQLLKEFLEENDQFDLHFSRDEGFVLNQKTISIHAIHLAAHRGHVNIIAILLKHNSALVNEKDFYGMTPLHYAAAEKHNQAISYLIEEGAEITLSVEKEIPKNRIIFEFSGPAFNFSMKFRGKQGILPLHLLVIDDQEDLVKILLEKAPQTLDQRGPNGNTPLHYACYAGHINIVKLLIEKGAKINLLNEFGTDVLQQACLKKGNLSIVKFLLTKNKELLNGKDNNGWTAMHYAAAGQDQDIVALLKEKGLLMSGTANDAVTTPLLVAEGNMFSRRRDIALTIQADPLIVKEKKLRRFSFIFFWAAIICFIAAIIFTVMFSLQKLSLQNPFMYLALITVVAGPAFCAASFWSFQKISNLPNEVQHPTSENEVADVQDELDDDKTEQFVDSYQNMQKDLISKEHKEQNIISLNVDSEEEDEETPLLKKSTEAGPRKQNSTASDDQIADLENFRETSIIDKQNRTGF